MRRTRFITLAFFAITLCSATVLATFCDGTYIGKASGHNGPIKVEVSVAQGKITDIEVIESEETPIISDTAFTEVSKAILASQELDVDTISGATFSSNAMISAVKNALADPGYKDGSYEVTTGGHNGSVTFNVTIKNGRIAKIEVLDHEETPIISDTAFQETSAAIIANQSTEVDTVTGATFSSRAMIAAVNDVLNASKSEASLVLIDGIYKGAARGINGLIKVQVTVDQGKLREISVLEQKETPGLGDVALNTIITQILDAQSVEVDVVAGATITSQALIDAVIDALN